jgi:hypothetical protein
MGALLDHDDRHRALLQQPDHSGYRYTSPRYAPRNFYDQRFWFEYTVPFLPVNSMYQPASYESDARICKIIPVNERYRPISIFEVFNISNGWSPTSMTTRPYIDLKAC